MTNANAFCRLPAAPKSISSKPWMKIALAVVVAVFSLLYVVQINLTATKGYEIRELERSLSTLQHEARVLRLQSLELQSMERLQAQLQEQGDLVRVDRPDGFISATATSVASR